MAITLEEFIAHLDEIGLMSADEVNDFLDELPLNRQPGSARRLVQEMLRHKRLTQFQADLMFKGKTKRLVVGNYIVLEKAGQGGMGRVFKARHRRMDRLVALKLLPFAARKSPESVARFEREIRAAARLSHPNIVTAHDADEADGRYFLVMEYVDGTDLLSLVKEKGPLAVETAVGYILQAAAGLAYAHAAKVIHLDIKPANLLLDQYGTIKILDMGLARIDDALAGDAPSDALIQDGKVMGTVDYIPPERVGQAGTVDHRADIYSLGCTLFYLLTGRPPYRAETILKRIQAHCGQPIPSLLSARNDVPERLDAVFQKMLAKNPDDRYGSMQEAIAALRGCLKSSPPSSESPGSAERERPQPAPAMDASDQRG